MSATASLISRQQFALKSWTIMRTKQVEYETKLHRLPKVKDGKYENIYHIKFFIRKSTLILVESSQILVCSLMNNLIVQTYVFMYMKNQVNKTENIKNNLNVNIFTFKKSAVNRFSSSPIS